VAARMRRRNSPRRASEATHALAVERWIALLAVEFLRIGFKIEQFRRAADAYVPSLSAMGRCISGS
jgi:hypothetical protein